jgi:hypothetical protein
VGSRRTSVSRSFTHDRLAVVRLDTLEAPCHAQRRPPPALCSDVVRERDRWSPTDYYSRDDSSSRDTSAGAQIHPDLPLRARSCRILVRSAGDPTLCRALRLAHPGFFRSVVAVRSLFGLRTPEAGLRDHGARRARQAADRRRAQQHTDARVQREHHEGGGDDARRAERDRDREPDRESGRDARQADQ